VKRRRGGPVKVAGSGFVIDLPDDESALVLRLVGELRTLLADPEPDSEVRLLLVRLFPVVHPDDPDAEFEYQRLMREELVASKMAAFDLVDTMLATDGAAEVDEGRLMAFMQAINSIRLVLGTMLGDRGFTRVRPLLVPELAARTLRASTAEQVTPAAQVTVRAWGTRTVRTCPARCGRPRWARSDIRSPR
jgi:hypothetical protein